MTEKPNRAPIAHIIAGIFVLLSIALFCYSLNYSLLIPLFLASLAIYLRFLRRIPIPTLCHLGLLLFLLAMGAHMIVYYQWEFAQYYLPVAATSMLTILLFKDIQLSFVMAFASSLVTVLILGGDFGMMLTFFLGSLVGARTLYDARRRSQLISAGVFVSLTHLVCLLLLTPDWSVVLTKSFMQHELYPVISSGFIATLIIVGGTMRIFEYIFGVITNYSLLELADFNQPLLKRMILEAPGTYHHSLVVGNLAEAAADAIGANALLTRVGAYYHDIGKLAQPEYFTENQLSGGNKHDDIEPSMSRLVIINHVKEGIELAQKYKLNQAIIDFIPQHHGTSLIHYFYQKSLESATDGEVIQEENYRYPGPKPQSRETAIAMLADSVEGATRALPEHNPTSIADTVKKVINNRFIDGQLDECNLTLKEIEKISSTFIRILTAMYHGRVKYPEKKNGTSHKK